MATHYLGHHALYVKNEDNLVYKVATFESFDNSTALYINLELVAGWDYVNPDENNVQGWCAAQNFIEEVQDETIVQYFIEESMKECLEANSYTILGKFEEITSKTLKEVIEKHNDY